MENFYQILFCEKNRFRVFLNHSNSDLVKKFVEINRDSKMLKKLIMVIEAVKINNFNRTQYNYEGKTALGDIYAIKVEQHRFYTLQLSNDRFRELFICRYGKKESEQNDKQLTTTIKAIEQIS